MPSHSERPTARISAVAWAGAWALFGAILLIASWRMDRLEDRGINPWSAPGLTPGVVGALMVVLALVLMWQAIWPAAPVAEHQSPAQATDIADTETPEGANPDAPEHDSWRSALGALLLCLGFAVGALGRGLPFWIAATLFIFVFTVAFSWPQWRAQRSSGSPLWRSLAQTAAVALLSSAAISWLFETVFLVRLP